MPDPVEKPRDLQKLFDKRDNLIAAVKFHANKVNAIQDDQAIEALSRLFALENAYEKFVKASDALENHPEFLYSDLVVKNEDIDDIFITKGAKLRMISKDLQDTSLFNSTAHPKPANGQIEVKLPQIVLPTFSGEYDEWTTFSDAFMSLVDNNTILSDNNKMHYLRSSLKGDALKVIGRLPVTDANYKIALKLLTDRFQNKRSIVNKCLSILMNQPEMKTRSAAEIRSLIDTTKESLDCVETLKISVDEWSPFVVFILQSKMEPITREAWETYLGASKEVPKLKLLYVFLETQFGIVESSSVDLKLNCNSNNANLIVNSSTANVNMNANIQPTVSTPAHSAYQNKNRASINANSKNQQNRVDTCLVCSENYWILNCAKFLSWTPVQRKSYAMQNKICIICLHVHEKDQCKSTYRCKKCEGPHSFKLHTEYDDIAHSSTIVATLQSDSKVFATAVIKVQDKFGANHLLRAFIDIWALVAR